MSFYFHFTISLEKQPRKIKICQVTFSRKKKKLEKPTTKLRLYQIISLQLFGIYAMWRECNNKVQNHIRDVLKVDFSLKNVQQPG